MTAHRTLHHQWTMMRWSELMPMTRWSELSCPLCEEPLHHFHFELLRRGGFAAVAILQSFHMTPDRCSAFVYSFFAWWRLLLKKINGCYVLRLRLVSRRLVGMIETTFLPKQSGRVASASFQAKRLGHVDGFRISDSFPSRYQKFRQKRRKRLI